MGARGSEIIGGVALLQLITGLVVIFAEEGALPTRMFDAWRLMPNAIDQYIIGLIGVAAGMSALFGLARNGVGSNPDSWQWFVLPLVVVWTGAALAVVAVLEGQFGDGVPRPRAFIFNDQSWFILLPLVYTWATLNRYAEGWDHEILGSRAVVSARRFVGHSLLGRH